MQLQHKQGFLSNRPKSIQWSSILVISGCAGRVMSYSVLMQDEPIQYTSAFDYSSIYTYSSSSQPIDSAGKKSEKRAEQIKKEASDLLTNVVAVTALFCSYLAVFFTLPVSVWFCFKTIPQWERVVIYRLGKLYGVKGPGNVFVIPWLDNCMKLDLRTQLITNPSKQVRNVGFSFLIHKSHLCIFLHSF